MTWLLTDAAHWGLALVPVLVLLAIFVWLDAFALMSFREILFLLLVGGIGGIAAYPLSGRLLDTLPIGFSSYSRFVAPWIEEAIKGVIVVLLFRFNRIGYKLDAVLSGFAIGAGFSVVENIVYLTLYPNYGVGTWLVRGLGTAVMHGTTLAIFAAMAHEFAERETHESAGDFNFNLLWFVPGYLIAVALHLAFNQFPDRPLLAMVGAMIIGPMVVMAIFTFGTSEAQRSLEGEHEGHQAQLRALTAGKWPDSAAGRKVAALSWRLGPNAAEQIRRYWELRSWLVVQAEQAMLDEAAGDVVLDREKIASVFAELRRLRTAIGRSAFAALKPLLPFSRNDDWEVSELRQRLRRQ
jgi:RsiW-degrading membrane proteinase PrsW (M82 family)